MKQTLFACLLTIAFHFCTSANAAPLPATLKYDYGKTVSKPVAKKGIRPLQSICHSVPAKAVEVLYAWFLWPDGCWHLYAGIPVNTIDPITGVGVTGIAWVSIDEDNGWVGTHTVCNNGSWENYC
jgi:hypothetical protein